MNLDFLTYLNLIFYVIIGLAILMGFLRGMKKTLFTLITMAIFYVVFFVTLGAASRFLWTLNMPWLAAPLSNIDPSLATFTSFSESLNTLLQLALGDTIDLTGASEGLIDLAIGIGLFAMKIIYTIVYFTVILIIYKLICLIIGAIFFKTDKGASKNRGLGALFGVLNGVMAVFITLIMMGGMMSVGESMLTLLPQDNEEPATLFMPVQGEIYEASLPIIALAEEDEEDALSPEMMAMIEDLDAMIQAYNSNLVVSIANKITAPSLVNPDETVPLHLNLFDRVLSFEFQEQTVAFRYELGVLSEVGLIFMESDFAETGELSDLTGAEIRQMFGGLGRSELIVSLMPLGVEIAADYFDTELPITETELYAIDFAQELPKLGEIAGALFDIMNGAGVISGTGDIQDIVIDGDFVRDLFADMSESVIIVTVVEVVLVPMLSEAEEGIGAILQVPADLDWEMELVAIGLILKEILDADLTFADLMEGDPTTFLNAASEVNLDVLLESRLISQTLIHILSGEAGIEGLEMLEIPTDIIWLDDDKNGELRNILVALEALLDVTDELDFENFNLASIAELTDSAIDDIFGSRVLVATISSILLSQDLGDTPLVIPDAVFDDEGYITSTEMKAVAKAIALILSGTGETATFQVERALNMSSTDIQKFLASEIVSATIGKLVYDLDIDLLTLPTDIVTTVDVDDVATSVIAKTELANLLEALALLELTDFDSITFSASLIEKFTEDSDASTIDSAKMTTFLASKIIHSSVSSMVLDLAEGATAVVVIPSLKPDGTSLVTETSGTDYLEKAEVTALFQALLTIDIDDFNNIDLEDTTLLLDNLGTLIDSSILHATISDQILGIGSTISIPYEDVLGTDIRITQAETTYISASELEAFVDAVDLFGFSDPASFTNNFSLSVIQGSAEQDLLLTSAIMHATISKTLLDLDNDNLIEIPLTSQNGAMTLRVETGPMGHKTEFVAKAEIKALIDGLGVLGILEVDDFDGTVGFSNLFASETIDYDANQTTLLQSSTLQATISEQLLDLPDSALIVPDTDVDGIPIRVTQGLTEYITVSEIKAIINTVDILGLGTNVSSMDGSFTLATLNEETTQDTMLSSASMHATISQKLFDVDNNILSIPEKREDNVTLVIESAGLPGSEKDFIAKAEVKALINALLLMEYDNLSGFSAEFELGQIFTNVDTILLSASLQAMFSNRLLNDTGTALIIPNEFYGTTDDIRIVLSDVTYIQKDELSALIHGLDDLGLSNLSAFSFTPGNIFLLDDFSGLLDSEILQATISKNILDIAKAENESPAIGELVIPNFFRQTIAVGLGNNTQIERIELEKMLESLKLLGIMNFGDDVEANDITAIFLDNTSANAFLASGSLHITVDNMVKHNANISASIPELAQYQVATYGINDVTKESELIAFVQAANALMVTDFTAVTFSFATIAALDASAQDTVLTSMIVRNKITPDVVSASLLPGPTAPDFDPLTPPLGNTDYEENNVANFLKKQSIKNVIDWYYPS